MEFYCDGSKTPNGVGWSVVYYKDDCVKFIGSSLNPTDTCARAEVYAMYKAIRKATVYARHGIQCTIYSDNQYVVKGIGNPAGTGWVKGWSATWKGASGKPVAHADLWSKMLRITYNVHVSVQWVRGHSGNPMNELSDKYAKLYANGITAE